MKSLEQIKCEQCGETVDISHLPLLTNAQCPFCEVRFVVPAKVDHFILKEIAGQGSMGEVYKALDESLQRLVAVKMLYADPNRKEEEYQKLLREARAAASLEHPHVVRIHHFGKSGDRPYLVMEWMDGGTVDDRLAERPVWTEKEVLDLAHIVFEALGKCHGIHLTHGDIKPSNFMYHQSGTLKLMDFGISHFTSAEWKNDIRGTPLYIAPEKAQGKLEDYRSDLYSMGIVMWRLLAGKPPFDAEDPIETVKLRFDAEPPDVREHAPNTTRQTARLIAKLMMPHPADRLNSHRQILSDIQRSQTILRGGALAGGIAHGSRTKQKKPTFFQSLFNRR